MSRKAKTNGSTSLATIPNALPAMDARLPRSELDQGPGCHCDRASASARRDATSCDVAVGSNTSTLIP